ncbi:hypothetical protein [Aeromicrobium sp. 179-A 4D2 NHS]|uniref:hypothetical protein n=1 Tax=Aeromicrobium sp. 179-A 4D2 NHS TaxID=3142375 RepID=UPI0039A39871
MSIVVKQYVPRVKVNVIEVTVENIGEVIDKHLLGLGVHLGERDGQKVALTSADTLMCMPGDFLVFDEHFDWLDTFEGEAALIKRYTAVNA